MEFSPSPADGKIEMQQIEQSSSTTSLDSILNNSDEEEFESSHPPSPDHKKYLYPKKEFVDNLRPEDVRWFYKREGDKLWKPFIGYDSLRIECRYRAATLEDQAGIDVDEKILVRGGLYDVDVPAKTCSPIYWTVSGDVSMIMRGVWFYDGSWQPVEDGYASQIETEHMATFFGQKLHVESFTTSPSKGPKPIIHNIKFQNFHVDWNSPSEVFLFSESASSKIMRHVSKSFGWQKSGTSLHRGYYCEAQMDDKPLDITHLVFVVHGIGQKMDTGAIVKCCKDLRERVEHIKHKYHSHECYNKRAEFLPVEWRSSLTLDGDTVDSITPHKMKGVRSILNSSAMDVLYYTSPLYRSEITHSLQHELNHLYTVFCSRHPYFEANGGKVSIVAHSLGAVITYDIMTGWNPINLYDQFVSSLINEESANASGSADVHSDLDKAKKHVKELEILLQKVHEKQKKLNPGLNFMLENLFCLGSPLAVFLALRGIRPQGKGSIDHILPTNTCKRLFNIFHPSDPVAYRLEPLILKHYSTIAPLLIHYYDSHKKTAYLQMQRTAYAAFTGTNSREKSPPVEEETDTCTPEKEISDINIVTVKKTSPAFSLSKWITDFRSSKKPEKDFTAELKMLEKMDQSVEEFEVNVIIDSKDIDKTELEYRLDYQLRERSLENSYMALLTSHTSYWTNKDVACFMVMHLLCET
ncbi:phospholipase DDHD1-like [Gigantopelta aegis]|uniref:phospholipase DDHD1-like n=1 Tax=Gigantopelta aegis TaxID=1735272 RepID=UPI001B88C8F0|nr:phospholipase DDHD1-like [Gigantopelta aegis]